MDFTFPSNYRIKRKENIMINKYVDLARELKKLWNMRVTLIPLVSELETVPKTWKEDKELETRGRNHTIQTTTLLRSIWILRRYCYSKFREKLPVEIGGKTRKEKIMVANFSIYI